jgi:outer membrane protein assembly factor BamC
MGAVMQFRNMVFGLVAVSLLAGCSSITDREVDYTAGAVKAPPLEVPPNLTVPETEQRYTIPGKDGEKVASYSEYTKQKTEQPCVSAASAPAAAKPVAATPPAAVTPSAKLQDNKGIKSILLGEPFDRSWRRVGLALDHAKLVTTDKDRSKGIFFIAAPLDKEKKKQPDYQVIVHENDGTESQVTAVDQNGKNDAETARLIDVIYQNLDKNSRGEGLRLPGGDAVRRSR